MSKFTVFDLNKLKILNFPKNIIFPAPSGKMKSLSVNSIQRAIFEAHNF